MPIPEEAIRLEQEGWREGGEHTLQEAFNLLQREWQSGSRDREIALHLMFLSWYGLCEPDFITGFENNETTSEMLQSTFNEVFRHFESSISGDAEMLYVVGLMAHLFPWFLDNDKEWENRSREYQQQYRAIAPNGIDPAIFGGRGAYGAYFGSQASVQDGY